MYTYDIIIGHTREDDDDDDDACSSHTCSDSPTIFSPPPRGDSLASSRETAGDTERAECCAVSGLAGLRAPLRVINVYLSLVSPLSLWHLAHYLSPSLSLTRESLGRSHTQHGTSRWYNNIREEITTTTERACEGRAALLAHLDGDDAQARTATTTTTSERAERAARVLSCRGVCCCCC